MITSSNIVEFFEQYKRNLEREEALNEAVLDAEDQEVWMENLRAKSRGLRQIYVENEALLNLYLRPFLEQESRLTKELAADEAIAVYDDPVVRSMDGYEAAGRIRQYEKKLKRKHLPIIALTANVFAEDSERALRAGMDAHMGKPVDVPRLLATMMHWIG